MWYNMSERALRRISLHKLMDLKVDYAFKQLFGSEKNKNITIVFLNAILNRSSENRINEVTFVNREIGGEFVEDKESRLDIVVRTQKNELINIEMQLSNQNNMMKRTLYYWARLFATQIDKGIGYEKLLPTITINICDFALFETDRYHSIFHLHENHSLDRLAPEDDVLEIHFIEMRKFIQSWYDEKLDPFDDILVRWLLLLGMVDARKQRVYDDIYKELEALAMNDERIREAFETWEELSRTPDEKIAYESRLKTIIDAEARLADARSMGENEGRKEGIKEGIEKGIEKGEKNKAIGVIIEGAKKGLETSMLADLTGHTVEEVEQILKEHRI